MNPNKTISGGGQGAGSRVSSVECRGTRDGRHVSRFTFRALVRRSLGEGGSRFTRAFTLIELLVVIAVIAILASLVFPVTAAVNRVKIRSKARVELAQLQMAIDNYRAKLGHFPPDNPGRPSTNQLYFELLGTTNIGAAGAPVYRTLDGSATISSTLLNSDFGAGVSGFVNCTPAGGGDEGRFATPFLNGLKPGQIAALPTDPNVKFIVCSVPSPNTASLGYLGAGTLTPFYYNSTNPTNNPSTYDLWVDVMIAGKTNRICNWTREILYP